MTRRPVVQKGYGALVRRRVPPNAKSTGLHGPYGEASLRLKVDSPPVDGEANAGVERFVAEATGAAPPKVRVVRRGLSGRDEAVFVDGVGAERVREVFSPRGR